MRTLVHAFLASLVAIATPASVAYAQTPVALDDAARSAAITRASDALRNRYIFPDVGERAALRIEAQHAAGAYKDLTMPRALADQLTKDLYEVTKDKHLRVASPGSADSPGGTPPPAPRNEAGVVRADLLQGNIGYIEISAFPEPGAFKPVIDKAMSSLRDTKALIIDDRRNGGGNAYSVAYLVSFFLDPAKPIVLNDFIKRTPNTNEFTTYASMSVATPTSYRGKPVYVLTSARTFSGGEELAYDMQAFQLGTLVGETTGGGANPGGMSPLVPGLDIFLPDGRPVNAITRTNWEGVGVIPEIRTPVEDALKVALEKLGQKPNSGAITELSVAKLFEPRSTATPGLEVLARRVIEGDTTGEQALDIMTPELAQVAQAQRGSLIGMYARLGPLKSLAFQGPAPGGGDSFVATFVNGSRSVFVNVGTDGKISYFSIGPLIPPAAE